MKTTYLDLAKRALEGHRKEIDRDESEGAPRCAISAKSAVSLPMDLVAVLRAALDRLEGDPGFPSGVMEALRAADVYIEPEGTIDDVIVDPEPLELGPDGWPPGSVDVNELYPCPQCGSLDQWQTMAGDATGMTPGKWRCRKCDPPVVSDRLAKRAAKLRRQRDNCRPGCTGPLETGEDDGS